MKKNKIIEYIIMLFLYSKVKQIENEHSVKLQCIICTDTFYINTKHNCLLRNDNQEFTIKFSVR